MRSYIPFLSLRYLRFHRLSSGLGILGVALGVGLVVVVVSVMDGFQTRLRRELLRNTAAVTVLPYYDVDADRLADALKHTVPGVVEASPVLQTMTLIGRTRGGVTVKYPCRIEGIDPGPANRLSPLADRLRTGDTPMSPLSLRPPATPEQPFLLPPAEAAAERRARLEKQGVIVGARLLGALRANVGDVVTLYTVGDEAAADAAEGGSPRQVTVQQERFRVTGMYSSGDAQVDELLVLMDRRDAASFFRGTIRREVSEVRLGLDDPENADAVKATIEANRHALIAASRRSPAAYDEAILAETWRDQNRRFLMAVDNERGLLLLISSFSFIVVAFLIGSTQSMLVVEKTREIGVLRSLGASVGGTASVFLGNGFFIGTIGAIGGGALGTTVALNAPVIAAWIKSTTGRDLFPEEAYRFSEVPIEVRAPFVLTVCLAAVGFAVLGSLLPALRAASLDPVASLHHE